MKIDTNSLPDDPEQLKKMLLELQQTVAQKDRKLVSQQNLISQKDEVIAEQQTQYQELLERYHAKIAEAFGKKSEKMPGAGETFNEAEAELDERDKELLADKSSKASPKNKPKRKPLPEQLPREEVIVDLDDSDKVCPCCQSKLHNMGESSSETLEFVPAHIKVIKTIRPKYACRHCEKQQVSTPIKQATMPAAVIPKSIATPSLLSHIISCKYQYGLPLNRQESWFGDIGIELNRKTMADWMLRCSDVLLPLYQKLQQVLLSQNAIHADETPLKVIKAEKATSYMWVYCCGDDAPGKNTNIVLYDYHNSRAASCVTEFLGEYAGYLQVDGYQAYGQCQATLVGCLAHIRRKFVEAQKAQGKGKTGKADVVLNLIGKLYGIEQQINQKAVDEKYLMRQQKSKPIIDKLHNWLVDHEDKIPPKSALGKAISYALNQFAKFHRYLDDGQLKIDNNRAERAVKPFVIGRKNWLFANTPSGAQASAILYSIVETAKANNLIVHEYLEMCLKALAEKPTDLDFLLPWNQ